MKTILYAAILLSLSSTKGYAVGSDSAQFYSSLYDSVPAKSTVPNTPKPASVPIPKKPELFNSGFLDFQNGGQMGASARVFRLFIGEPNGFMLPVSVYAGVSGAGIGNNPGAGRNANPMIMSIINPLSGSFNISIDHQMRFNRRSKKLTGFS